MRLLSDPKFQVSSSVFRIRVETKFADSPMRYGMEVVVQRGVSDEESAGHALQVAKQTFQVLAWHER